MLVRWSICIAAEMNSRDLHTTLRRCAGEQAISVEVVINTILVVVVFRFMVDVLADE